MYGCKNILHKYPVLITSVLGQYIESMLTDIGGIVTYDGEQNKCISLSSPISCCKISVLSTYSRIRKNICYLYTEIILLVTWLDYQTKTGYESC